MSYRSRIAAATSRARALSQHADRIATRQGEPVDLEAEWQALLDHLCAGATTVTEGEAAVASARNRLHDDLSLSPTDADDLAGAVRAELMRRGVLPTDESNCA